MKTNVLHNPLAALAVSALVAPWLAGCEGFDISDRQASGVGNPMAGPAELMPWPSSVFLAEDPSTVTGYRIDLPAEAMPVSIFAGPVDATPWSRLDGFSPSGAILAAFESGVSPEGLPGSDELELSLSDDAPIAIIDMERGERVPHFAEVDENTLILSDRSLIIRPVVRLRPATRYAVAIRDSVRAADGGTLLRPEAFQALLDGESVAHPLFFRSVERHDAVMGALAEQGIAEDELVLAWDFVTASDESLTRDMRAMQEQALQILADEGDQFGFEAELVEEDTERLYGRYVGTFDAPNFLSDGENDDTRIIRDEAGLPVRDGNYRANFSLIVPQCAAEAELPLPVVVFGHGLFGSSEGYFKDKPLQEVAEDYCFVLVGSDWIGLTSRQLTTAIHAANDMNLSNALGDMLGQSVINFIALEMAVRNSMSSSEIFTIDGRSVIDVDQVHYMGVSLGGIMGGTFMAYDPHIKRGVLGVPGGSWSLLMERSFAWGLFQPSVVNAYKSQFDYQVLLSLLAMSLERWDPITTAERVLRDPFPGVPPKQLFLYEAVNDSLVHNLTTEMLARTLDIPVTAPSVRLPFGLKAADEPVASGLTIFDERVSAPPDSNVPPADDNGTHAGINSRGAVLRAMHHFLLEGELVHACEADERSVECDCTMGVCD